MDVFHIFQASRRSCKAALYNLHASASCSSNNACCLAVGYKRYLNVFRTSQQCRKRRIYCKAYQYAIASKFSHRPCGAKADLKQGKVSCPFRCESYFLAHSVPLEGYHTYCFRTSQGTLLFDQIRNLREQGRLQFGNHSINSLWLYATPHETPLTTTRKQTEPTGKTHPNYRTMYRTVR
jgi:hypothetical protein